MTSIKDSILQFLSGIPFAALAVVAVVLILRAIKKIKRKAVGLGLLIGGIALLFPSVWMTLRQSNQFLTGILAPKKSLSYAVEHLDAAAVKELLANGADPDSDAYSFFKGNYASDENGESPVDDAIEAKSPEKLRLLLDYGAELKSEYLVRAVQSANPETVKLLIDRGADPNAKYEQTGETIRDRIKKQFQTKIDRNQLNDQEKQVLRLVGINV